MEMVVAILAEKEVISSIAPGGGVSVLTYKEIKIIKDYL